jgi:uncharacterized membrane protein
MDDGPDILGPVLAGGLILVIGLNGILVINLLAFMISISALLFVKIPPIPRTADGEMSQGKFFKEAIHGFRYILERPGLLGLQLVFFFGNLFSGIALSVAALYPMILLRSGNDIGLLGIVQSDGALAAALTGFYLALFGGIKRPVSAILLGWILSSLFGLVVLGIGQVAVIWVIAYMINSIFDPVVNVSIKTFLQAKIPPDQQGRVFSASDFMAQAVIPFTPLLAGFLGDSLFEPAMTGSGTLSSMFGWIVGTGPGSGFGLMILLCGIGGTLVGLSGYLFPVIRNVDEDLPDFVPPPPVGLVRRVKKTGRN